VLGLLLWIGIGQGLRPLAALAGEVAQRDPDNLAPLAGRAPREVAPVIEQLNRLFARIERSLERERRFTADAAHELRTPVAGIKAQAQVARLAAGEGARNRALDQVVSGADRAARLVEQLLTLARLDSADRSQLHECDLRELALQCVAELAPAALNKGVSLELADGVSVQAPVIAPLVQVLLRNLIDNAIRHSNAGSEVRVRVALQDGAAQLSVTDSGPGIPADQREKVLMRFYRLPEAGEGGSGLGLSIVQRIAEIHGAQLALAEAATGKGLEVHVRFPLQA
jgi:two-component system, OmpR family, sensor kinase